MDRIHVTGELMGVASDPTRDGTGREIVRVVAEFRPNGPADNAIIAFDRATGRARYLSWIGYFDLDCAAALSPGRWTIVDPATPWETAIRWIPFGRFEIAPSTWNGGPMRGLTLPRDGGLMRPARQSRYRRRPEQPATATQD